MAHVMSENNRLNRHQLGFASLWLVKNITAILLGMITIFMAIFVTLQLSTDLKSKELLVLWEPFKKYDSIDFINPLQNMISCMDFSSDTKLLAIGYEDGQIVIVNTVTKKRVASFLKTGNRIAAVNFSHDISKIVAISGQMATIYNVKIPEVKKSYTVEADFKLDGGKVAFTQDGKQLMAQGREGAVFIWDMEKGNPLWNRLSNDIDGRILDFLSKKKYAVYKKHEAQILLSQ